MCGPSAYVGGVRQSPEASVVVNMLQITGGAYNASSYAAGLGDIAVPGLLACLALRYDASRSTNMRARADAAAEALKGAFSQMDVSTVNAASSC